MKWAYYLQQFHLVIKYRKGNTNSIVDCLSHPPIVCTFAVISLSHVGFQVWASQYATDFDFGEKFVKLTHPSSSNLEPYLDFHLEDGLLYRLDKLCVPKDHHPMLLKEAHPTLYGEHFDKHKTLHQFIIFIFIFY